MSPKTTEALHHDVVIVGGGMVGAALACALAPARISIAVIEGRPLPTDAEPDHGFDLRVSAITRASQRLFEQLGVWQAMTEQRVSPYREMFVWDAEGRGSIHFDSAEIGEPDLGHIIENRVITRALTRRLGEWPNITLYSPAQPQRLRSRQTGLGTGPAMALRLADGRALETGLVIGADGSRSWVRDQAGIPVTTRSYHQQAVVSNVLTEQAPRETAWQRFLPTGPLAFLPLTNGWSSIVWSTTPGQAEALLAMSEDDFHAALGEAFEFKLGNIVESGPRAAFPLQGQHARQYVKPGLALVGDAAHTIHPLAGQGVNLGFADVACLAELLLTAWQAKHPLGSLKTLRRYERARKGENLIMLESMGLFKRVFGGTAPWMKELRNLGLLATDHCPPVKHWFMQQALGQPLER